MFMATIILFLSLSLLLSFAFAFPTSSFSSLFPSFVPFPFIVSPSFSVYFLINDHENDWLGVPLRFHLHRGSLPPSPNSFFSCTSLLFLFPFLHSPALLFHYSCPCYAASFLRGKNIYRTKEKEKNSEGSII